MILISETEILYSFLYRLPLYKCVGEKHLFII